MNDCYICNKEISVRDYSLQIQLHNPGYIGATGMYYLIHFKCFKEEAGGEYTNYFTQLLPMERLLNGHEKRSNDQLTRVCKHTTVDHGHYQRCMMCSCNGFRPWI